MVDFNWDCPHCERAVTISSSNFSNSHHDLDIENVSGKHQLETTFIVCPNIECRKYSLMAFLHKIEKSQTHTGGYKVTLRGKVAEWSLVPASRSKHFPEYIPKVIRDDYEEACLIQDLSPKASATLSRRCLQGMLRDFWDVKTGKLNNEIEQIKERIDLETWAAIDAVRQLGNIGAHMEVDINVIISVDPEEAKLLIRLVETLMDEWYVAREDRKNRMMSVVSAADNKKEAKKNARRGETEEGKK
jgi:hypothetical protein